MKVYAAAGYRQHHRPHNTRLPTASRAVCGGLGCGIDPITKVDHEHRKAMVAARIRQLAGIFAVDVYGYAVMSNHLHVVLAVEPTAANGWSDQEIAERWVRLFPPR